MGRCHVSAESGEELMIDKSKFVNHKDFSLDMEDVFALHRKMSDNPFRNVIRSGVFPHSSFLVVNDLIGGSLLQGLIDHVKNEQWLAVGNNGRAGQSFDKVGNYRISTYSEDLADLLWSRLSPQLHYVRTMRDSTPTDHDNHPHWKAIGVNPLFRFIRYESGGELVAHYDETFIKNDEQRTLMSLIIYLTTNRSGATRFIRDPQANKPMDEMDFSDWNSVAPTDEVIAKVSPLKGSALIFDHRMLHDGEPLQPGESEKIIIRSDIMFEKIYVR